MDDDFSLMILARDIGVKSTAAPASPSPAFKSQLCCL